MPAPTNRLEAALARGQTQRGSRLNAGSPEAVEIAGATGVDWCLIDGEHGPWSPEAIVSQLRALDRGGTSAVVRVPVGEDWVIKQALDICAQTLLVPMVDTGVQGEQVGRAARYAPDHARGPGSKVARVARWARDADDSMTANDRIGPMVQAETRAATENLGHIRVVEGDTPRVSRRAGPGRPDSVSRALLISRSAVLWKTFATAASVPGRITA